MFVSIAFTIACLSTITIDTGPSFEPKSFENVVVLSPAEASPRENKAVTMFVEEVERRTQLRWPVVHKRPKGDAFVIVVTDLEHFKKVGRKRDVLPEMPATPEAYSVRTRDQEIQVVGRDERGVLFGVGYLLRTLGMTPGKVSAHVPDIATAPDKPLRGHQLGFRPKTNSYDAWTPEMWEQYIRDLAVFGSNAVELIPPRSDDAPTSPHFPLPQIEMMKRMSQICDDYGIDVWIWYPALDKDYSDPAIIEFALKEWHEVFKQLPRIDHVFVPGGDPGHTEPLLMMNLLDKQTENLHKTHPNAKIWMSPQGFTKVWMDTFLDYMKTKQPAWLAGVVFGPQNRMKIADLRAALPPQYPIRHYPDITHAITCQFPVPDWDLAYVLTEHRESVNPRPTQMAHIYELFDDDMIGFLTYSEGCNDDVNKVVWSSLGWNPEQSPVAILEEYARYFIGPILAKDYAAGLFALEQNWTGPLLKNEGVMKTLAAFQAMEKAHPELANSNWRFQQGLYRAYYDAYDYQRLQYETKLEQDALAVLGNAKKLGSKRAMEESAAILAKAMNEPVAQDLRARVFELADALYNSIRMQLSVSKYKAISVDRGANLDFIDQSINNRPWLAAQFISINAMKKEKDRLKAIDTIVRWEDAGPGGYYDDFGDPERQPHLVRSAGYPEPEFKVEPNMGRDDNPGWRTSWNTFADTRYEQSLHAHYTGLDPAAHYTLRVTYAGDSMDRKMHLDADGQEVHPFIDKPSPPKPIEFSIPQSATGDGDLKLTWNQEPGRGGGGRGCQVAEVWLIKSK